MSIPHLPSPGREVYKDAGYARYPPKGHIHRTARLNRYFPYAESAQSLISPALQKKKCSSRNEEGRVRTGFSVQLTHHGDNPEGLTTQLHKTARAATKPPQFSSKAILLPASFFFGSGLGFFPFFWRLGKDDQLSYFQRQRV